MAIWARSPSWAARSRLLFKTGTERFSPAMREVLFYGECVILVFSEPTGTGICGKAGLPLYADSQASAAGELTAVVAAGCISDVLSVSRENG